MRIRPYIYTAFFLSGFAALVYQLIWIRILKQVLGSDNLALSTILTVFIGGVALGTYVIGEVIDRYFRSDKTLDSSTSYTLNLGQIYLLICIFTVSQLIIGLYGTLVPWLFGDGCLGLIWSFFAGFALEHSIVSYFLKFILSGILLFIPTVLMGFNFPVLTELLAAHQMGEKPKAPSKLYISPVKREEKSVDQFAASSLYAINTFGAVLGTAVCGFCFLPLFGLNTSNYIAAFINLFIALCMFLWLILNQKEFHGANLQSILNYVINLEKQIQINKTKIEIASMKEEKPAFDHYHKIMLVLLLISFATGFFSLSLEVIWTKLLSLIIGSSTQSLTIIIVNMLLGWLIGTSLMSRFIAFLNKLQLDSLTALKRVLLSFALSIVFSSFLFNQIPWFFLKLSNLNQELVSVEYSSITLIFIKFVMVAMIILPVTIIDGLLYGFVLYLVSSDTNLIDTNLQEPVGTRVARAAFMSTLGAIVGSFLAGFIFMPLFNNFGSGIFITLKFIILLAFLLILAPYLISKSSTRTLNVAAVLLVVSLIALPKFNVEELSSGVSIYNSLKFKNLNRAEYRKAIKEKILFHKEGINNIVTVVKNEAANAIFLKNNGKIEAGMPIKLGEPSHADMPTQILLGEIPGFIKSDAKSALVIGMGSGITLKSLAKSSNLKTIDVCEIEKLVYEAADKFFGAPKDGNYQGIHVKRHVADARNFLLAQNSRDEVIPNYEIIISQPSDPWISTNLFTHEFWKLAANNLSNNGIFVQWLQLYSINPEYLSIALRTFHSVFPHVMVFRPGDAGELILIGSKQPIKLDTKVIQAKFKIPQIRKELASISINDDADLFSNLLLVPEAIDGLIGTNYPGQSDIKLETKISTQQKTYKPKLGNVKLKPVKTLTNTDDNMLLEFHTASKISEFSESIKANEVFIQKYRDPQALIKFLADSEDKTFLNRISIAMIERSPNPFNQLLAERLHAINATPLSYLALYESYKNTSSIERLDSIVYEAKSKFADIVSFNDDSKNNGVILFKGLTAATLLEPVQLAALAHLYAYNREYERALKLVNKALDSKADLLINLYRIKAEILFMALKSKVGSDYEMVNLSSKELSEYKEDIADIAEAFSQAIEFDKFDSQNYIGLGDFYVFRSRLIIKAKPEKPKKNDKKEEELVGPVAKIEADPTEVSGLINSAIASYRNALKINPSASLAHYKLAEIYLSRLPESQMQLMKANASLSYAIDEAIHYLKNTLILKPAHIEANYFIADLEYKVGNLAVADRHINRLMDNVCAKAEATCKSELGEENYAKAQKLYKKLNELF